MDKQVSGYLSAVRSCWTKNGVNQLHKQLEGTLTPSEISKLNDPAMLARAPDRSVAWLARLRTMSPGLFDAPAPFERQPLGLNVTLYSDRLMPAENKGLLIAFAGNSGRLLMPVAVFLQALNVTAWDMVLIQRGKQPLLEGIEGITGDFGGVLAYVRRLAHPDRYRDLVTLGVSSGGYLAILAAVHLGARRGVSVGGSLLHRTAGLEAALTSSPRSPTFPDLRFVYGAKFPPDRDAALAMEACWGGRGQAVQDAGIHNALKLLLDRGALPAFLQELLS